MCGGQGGQWGGQSAELQRKLEQGMADVEPGRAKKRRMWMGIHRWEKPVGVGYNSSRLGGGEFSPSGT